jgi:hypothetical protein
MKSTLPALVVVVLLSACSGSSSTPGNAAAGGAARGAADTWATNWCQAMPGNTREQLIALMGPPTSTPPNQLGWITPKVSYLAFLNAEGVAKQLDISSVSMSDAERAALKCKPTRTLRAMQLAAAEAAKTPHSSTPACELVSAAEMSKIVGAPVTGKAEDHPGSSTKCTYSPVTGISPSVEFTVSWGEGYTAMKGMGLAGSREQGLVTPYDGIGDQAGAAGPLVMIRTGDHLVTLVLSGVADQPAAARRIFDTAKPRM